MTTSATRTLTYYDYTVGWICAIDTEYVAACELLDQEDTSLPSQSPHDSNAYSLGRIGDHNVVIACLPKGRYGITSAANMAKDMLRSFMSIRIGLMVGIGGGAPSEKHDIRLGDVVVSTPTGKTGGVIHYEFGKTIQDKKFEFTGSLNAPPTMILTALNKVSMTHRRKGHRIAETVAAMVQRNRRIREQYRHPGTENDRLYVSNHIHVNRSEACQVACGNEVPPLIKRELRGPDQDDPAVHYGLIASSDRLMKDATIRDQLSKVHDVLCFEMEAAGLMDNFQCLVIRGICDYSDTHKNDQWQGYAAATAAAYAKELLCAIPAPEIMAASTVADTIQETGKSP
jgi:nucleoside phosphorylase